ncbi:hypothetical protein QBC44DRAFT_287108 [Cladorrhinum sp. PSN332]|nr:hypothetical protein QBC44DRAFT_287108 [Cladorrhinum sp. PSN332]
MADEFHSPLRCNMNGCSAELNGTMVVMACRCQFSHKISTNSHCICPQCAINTSFSDDAHAICPICQASLSEDDILQQTADPGQEWQNLVLCGLNPTIIMSAAESAIQFFAFQLTLQMCGLCHFDYGATCAYSSK